MRGFLLSCSLFGVELLKECRPYHARVTPVDGRFEPRTVRIDQFRVGTVSLDQCGEVSILLLVLRSLVLLEYVQIEGAMSRPYRGTGVVVHQKSSHAPAVVEFIWLLAVLQRIQLVQTSFVDVVKGLVGQLLVVDDP